MRINLSSFLQWRFNIFLYLNLGWKTAKIYVFLLGKLHFALNKRDRTRIENAILEVIGTRNKGADIRKITKNVFAGIISHYYEKLFIAFEEPAKATEFLNRNIISQDLMVLKKELLKGNGVVLVTGHYGAIEYIPTLLAVNNFSVSMIAKFKSEQLRKKVFSQAKKYNITLIDAENTGNVLRSAIQELKKNRVLITQCDEIEEWRPSISKKTSFLGRITGLDRTINIIQKRTGCEVVFGVIHRYSLIKYRLIMHHYQDMLQILDNGPGVSVGETVLKFLERFIYANPEQWYQWKKYIEIKGLPASGVNVERTMSLPSLKPSFGKTL